MELRFLAGLIGSLVLITGVSVPARSVPHPARSTKNWLFALGNTLMFVYAVLGYLGGGPIFFFILQIFVAVSTVLMMFNTPDRIDTPILALVGVGLVAWSLNLYEDYSTAVFVLGLTVLSVGFALENGTLRRNIALSIGAVCIAVFSYLLADWIFFWLNAFFAVISGFYAVQIAQKAAKLG